MNNYCYEFGRAVANFRGQSLDMSEFCQLCLDADLIFSCGSNGLRDAMIGAFDEFKRVAALYDTRNNKQETIE